jgi:hypothetical protein
MSHEKRYSRGERALIAMGILVPTGILAWVGIDRKLNTVPQFVPPAQRIPAPNALDTLRQAHALGANTWQAPAKKFKEILEIPLVERQKLLQKNKKAIAGIRTALGQSYATPLDWERPFTVTFPQYTEHREQARLLYFAARTHADAGNRPEAVRCALDAIELGILVSSDGPLIGHLVGVACESMGRKALWELADTLSASEAEQALTRLDTVEKRRAPAKKFLEIERAFAQKSLYDLAHHKMTAADFVMTMGFSDDKAEQGRQALAIALTDKGKAWQANGQFYNALEAYWSRPYAQGTVPTPPADPINSVLAPAFSMAHFGQARHQTDLALLRGCLMLKMQNTPEHFEAPADPFGQNRPLRYEKTVTGYRLWSVGPDGKDDGGKPLTPRMKDTRGYDATQIGDVVARVNTF